MTQKPGKNGENLQNIDVPNDMPVTVIRRRTADIPLRAMRSTCDLLKARLHYKTEIDLTIVADKEQGPNIKARLHFKSELNSTAVADKKQGPKTI